GGVGGRDGVGPREARGAGLDRTRRALEEVSRGLVLRWIGCEIVREAQLPADAFVAAEQALHGGEAGDHAVEVGAVLGLEIERALDAQEPRVEEPLGRAGAGVIDDPQERGDRGGVDLVARAAYEVERLGRDVAIAAGERRRVA